MNGLIVFVAIVIISAMIGAISRWLKSQQQQEQERLARERSGTRTARSDTTVDTIDRYVQEIERLRKRPAGSPAVNTGGGMNPALPPVEEPRPRPARVVPAPTVVLPTRRTRPPEGLPVARPKAPVVRRLDDLPVAPVVSQPSFAPAAVEPRGRSPVTARPEVSKATLTAVPPFLALLSSPQGLATAIALQEVLGPPKCHRRPGRSG